MDRYIARTIEELPLLPEDYMRLVRVTGLDDAERTAREGLNCEMYGLDQRSWPFSNAESAEKYMKTGMVDMGSGNPYKFERGGDTLLVMDMPNQDYRDFRNLKNDVVPPDDVVGIIPKEW